MAEKLHFLKPHSLRMSNSGAKKVVAINFCQQQKMSVKKIIQDAAFDLQKESNEN